MTHYEFQSMRPPAYLLPRLEAPGVVLKLVDALLVRQSDAEGAL